MEKRSHNNSVSLLSTLCVLCALGVSSAFSAEPTTKPDHFVISYWCGPPARFLSSDRVKEIKDANFNLGMLACGSMTVEQNRQMLDYCQQHGLRAIIYDSRIVYSIGGKTQNNAQLDAIIKDYGGHPALYGYFIVDEPGAGAFAGLAEVVAYLKEKDPSHPAFINMLPTYGRDFNVLGTKTYDEYLSTYAKTVKPFAICYDHYHFTYHGDRVDFFENLQTARKVSLESKIPFWNIVLATQHFDYRNLTEPELRFEAMQTLAFGGKGLLWFTYWSPAESDKSVKWEHALINPDGTRDPHYDMVKRVNADTLAIGEELFPCQSVSVTTPPLDAQGVPHGLTIGTFRHPSGKSLMLITNADYKQPAEAKTPAEAKAVELFDAGTRKWSAAGGELKLPAGGAALIRW